MRTLHGTVVSAKMKKTIVVRVDRLNKHPKYGKYYRVSGKFSVHDEACEYQPGDVIMIEETRPLSRTKRWRATALVKRPAKAEDKESLENIEQPETQTSNI